MSMDIDRLVPDFDDEDALTEEETTQFEALQKALTPERLKALAENYKKYNAKPDLSDEPKPCLFCGKLLECAFNDWSTKQPHEGGEVQFIFSYGSTKFDKGISNTVFSAMICDGCAETFVPRMKQETNLDKEEE